ncbi:MAG: hypothetical protein GWM98_19595 [Nitrospinaceae bacterium]|nr:hypothetical protein [Nitrospinaceae bacterium]NIS87272.1 hypothetical protein [Nitrospinaceae bacterium]NIT83571.1 hypothetical protein [Nitrospinaceae bacterium]NIU46313.1 hypothetical protein [Nitrospinaceae bacterium]NIU98490.1 hypothetical protein [Nitrospinaceae bacterium]
MLRRLINLVKLIQIVKERGNRKLIRKSRKQLLHFILCRDGLNRKPWYQVPGYWWTLLRGLDVLVWRLETFGFLYGKDVNPEIKDRLNVYL